MNEAVQKSSIELRLIDKEEKIVAANDGAIERSWHDSETPNLCVDFGYKELTCMTDLLFLGLDQSTWNFIAQNNALNVELNSRTLVRRKVVNGDEFLPVFQNLF